MGKQNRDACFLQWETCGRNGSYRSPNPHRVPEVTSPPSRAAAVPAFRCIQRLLGKAYRALSTSMDNLAWLFLMAKKIIMLLSLLWTFSKLEEWVPEKENTFSFSGFATVFRYFLSIGINKSHTVYQLQTNAEKDGKTETVMKMKAVLFLRLPGQVVMTAVWKLQQFATEFPQHQGCPLPNVTQREEGRMSAVNYTSWSYTSWARKVCVQRMDS